MSVRRWLTEGFRDFNAAFNLPYDYDLPDEPSAMVAHLPAQPADTSPLGLIPECVDGSAGPEEEAGPADHPNQWPIDWNVIRSGLAELAALVTILEIKQ